MRTIEYHKINPTNDTLTVEIMDPPGHGGASHHYSIYAPDWTRDPDGSNPHNIWDIHFQNGPIAEHGVNGMTQEILLAIVIDRLRSFQAGQFSSRENALALTKCEEALHWLQQRTLDRMRRGVEGKTAA